MPNTEHDLACINVNKSFDKVKAVDNVSFTVPNGSFFSILGPSGCGKTTLMRMIAGFEKSDSGDIQIKGRSVISTPPNKRNVKMVFQHLALFPMMNVFDNIAYGLRCQGTKKADIKRKVHDVLNRIALPDVAMREIHQLSGGQKQRIAIARCMVLEPDVLLLDEPLGALDLKLREAMKVELKLLQNQFNTSFVYITHDQSEALVMSDHVAIMNQGKFEQIGTPQDLYHNPETAFVASFVGDSNTWQAKVTDQDSNDKSIQLVTDNGFSLIGQRATDARYAPGQNVSVFVRPEFIQIERDGLSEKINSESFNRVSGKVSSLLFNGANSRALIKTERETLIEADITLTGGTDDIKPDDQVSLVWPKSKTAIFSH